MVKTGPYIRRLLLLLKHSLIFHTIDKSTKSFLDNTINWFFTSIKYVF